MLDQIREQLQEGMHDYTLKTDEEIIKILCEFGSGETDFHTADVERLLKQKQWQEKRIKELEAEKEHHSLDNFTHAEIVQHLEDYY